MRQIALVLAGPFFFLLFGCNQTPFSHSNTLISGKKSDEKTGGEANPGQPNFQIVKAAVFKDNCMECHSAERGKVKRNVNLDTYATTLVKLSDIEMSLRDGNMPPESKPPLDPSLKELVIKWIEMGAPE